MFKVTDQELQELQKKFPSALGYLTTILLIEREIGTAGNARLAARLGVSKPAANQAIGRLKKLGLTEQDLYGAIILTPEGKRYASAVLRRHYLIEHLLITKLGYPWEKSDEEAQRLQVSLSEEFTDYLCEYFGRPRTCPHGNPLPGSEEEEALLKAPRLTEVPAGVKIKLLRITEEGESVDGLLRFCRSHDLMPGRWMSIKDNSAEGVTVEVHNATVLIPAEYAAYICYQILDTV